MSTDLRNRIIRSTDTIKVEHPVFMLCGLPGICKTSVAFSMRDPLLLAFDPGVYRAANRRDTWPIDTWADVDALMKHPEILEPFASVIVDTVGRCVQLLVKDIENTEARLVRNGSMNGPNGWSRLKNRFRSWLDDLRAMGKDVLLIAHAKEDKEDNFTTLRADIMGGSYDELMMNADFIGTIHLVGKQRVLDFSPSERWVGKNPAGWDPKPIPHHATKEAQTFMAELFDQGRAALGRISEASAKLAQQVEDWRADIQTYTKVDEFNRAVPQIQALGPTVTPQVGKLLKDRAAALGFIIKSGQFAEAPAPQLVESFL
jgi:AAA domain